MQVVVAEIVDFDSHRLRRETVQNQGGLRSLGVTGDEVEIAQAAGASGVAAREFRALHQEERIVIGLAHSREYRRRHKGPRFGSTLLSGKLVGNRLAERAESPGSQWAKLVRGRSLRRKPIEEPVYPFPQSFGGHVLAAIHSTCCHTDVHDRFVPTQLGTQLPLFSSTSRRVSASLEPSPGRDEAYRRSRHEQPSMTGAAASPSRFVILATQRTGSTWLTDMLDSHPAISSYEELFLPADEDRRSWGPAHQEFFDNYYQGHVKHQWPLTRLFWALKYLEDLYAPRPGTDAVGMKLMYSQLKQRPWLLAYMVLRRVRIVHLVRSNLLDVILSGVTAKARSQYHALASDVVAPSTVTLPANDLVSELESLQRSVDRIRVLLKLLPAASIEVSYEELTRNDAAFRPVFGLLGVEPRRLSSRFAKLNREPKAELIANYAEVQRALSGTRFEPLLTT